MESIKVDRAFRQKTRCSPPLCSSSRIRDSWIVDDIRFKTLSNSSAIEFATSQTWDMAWRRRRDTSVSQGRFPVSSAGHMAHFVRTTTSLLGSSPPTPTVSPSSTLELAPCHMGSQTSVESAYSGDRQRETAVESRQKRFSAATRRGVPGVWSRGCEDRPALRVTHGTHPYVGHWAA
jgi:hypothetical protein